MSTRSLNTSSTTTSRLQGDFAPHLEGPELTARRRQVIDRPWVWLRQVHGATVLEVDASSVDEVRGQPADALVTSDTAIALAIHTADCAPVVLAGDHGVVGAAHVGWRGLEAGVLESTVATMRARGVDAISAAIGPCIGVECYEFGVADRSRLVERFDPSVAGTTSWGTPAFDLAAAVKVVLARVGVDRVARPPVDERCTACQPERYYSHRARADTGRMATVVWLDE